MVWAGARNLLLDPVADLLLSATVDLWHISFSLPLGCSHTHTHTHTHTDPSMPGCLVTLPRAFGNTGTDQSIQGPAWPLEERAVIWPHGLWQ